MGLSTGFRLRQRYLTRFVPRAFIPIPLHGPRGSCAWESFDEGDTDDHRTPIVWDDPSDYAGATRKPNASKAVTP